MAEEKYAWLGAVVKYLVLPISAIAIIYFVIQSFFGSNKAIDAISRSITDAWDAFDEALKAAMDDGVMDDNERATLDDIIELIKQHELGLENAIFNPTETAKTVTIVGGLCIALYTALKQARGFLGDRRQTHLRRCQQIGADGNDVYYMSTPEALAMAVEMDGIMGLADLGKTVEASNLYTVLQTKYSNVYIPQMQASHAALMAAIPNLTGVQLAMAQMMVMQYAMFFNWYQVTLPPMLQLPIPF